MNQTDEINTENNILYVKNFMINNRLTKSYFSFLPC